MEGNLSLADAKAAISDQEELKTDEPPLAQKAGQDQDDGAWDTSKLRRRNLLIASFFASGLWLGIFSIGVYWAISQGQLTAMAAVDMAALTAAFGVPLCLIWIVTLVLQRSDPLLERRLAIARTLQASIAPVDAAEAKLDRMLERLRRDIVTVDQTVLLASERISALEDRFKDQVSNLFSATTDAEAKSASIREQLRRERDSVEGLIDDLSKHLANMRTTIEHAADQTIQSELSSREAFGKAAKTFEQQYTSLLSASDTATKGISAAMSGLAERTTALDAAALSVTQKLGKGAAALKSHEADYRSFVDQFSQDFKAFDSAIDTRLVALEVAQNRLDEVGGTTAERLESLGNQTYETVDAALQKTASAADGLEKHKSDVASFMDNTLAALDAAQEGYLENLETFKTHTQDLSEQASEHIKATQAAQDMAAKDLFHAVQRHVDQWTDELSRFNLLVSDGTERAGSVAASRIQQAKDSLLESVEGLSQATDERVMGLQSSITQRMEQLTGLIETHQKAIDQQSLEMSGQLEDFTGATHTLNTAVSQARGDITQMRGELDEALETLGAAAKDNAAEIVADLEDMSRQTQSLLGLPQTITQSWTEALESAQAAGSELAENSAAQLGSLTSAATQMKDASDAISQTVSQSAAALSEVTKKLDSDVTTSKDKIEDVKEAASAIETSILDAQSQLGALSDGFTKLKETAADTSAIDLAEMTAAQSQIEDALAAFEAMANALRDKAGENTQAIMADYRSTLEQASKMAEDTDAQALKAAHNIAQSANKAIDLARMKWSEFSEEKQAATLEHFESMATSLKSTLDDTATQVGNKLEDIDARARTALAKLSEDASAAAVKNEETLKRVDQLTKRVEHHTTQDLIRASSLIVDALNSLSIDINKSLNAALSDDDWAKYLAGDKSIFTRKTVQAMSKSEKEALRKRLDQDADLKETVFRYLKDFELLMTRAMRGNEPTSLSIAIVSSDIGKLYVALSQSVRRLN
jgi:hypothetical protein